MEVKLVDTAVEINKLLDESKNKLVVIHFAADWAPQCAQMLAVLHELSKDIELKSVVFVQVEAESVPEIAQQYEVSSVPTIVLLKNKVAVETIHGANAPKLTSEVKKHAADDTIPFISKTTTVVKEDLTLRLTKLVNLHKCMIFMKGNPQNPKCGFSRQLIDILQGLNADFKSFDILTDEDVRQGLKEFSKWPTYPQVYVNGELLGGLDIIKEMQESGDLEEAIPRQMSLDDRLKALVNKAEITIFMKGNRDQPRCGFSKQLIAILNETGLTYETFDILEDEEVRQGLKTFSNWPTYPQIYSKGNLVGGLDIIKELQESGELLATLKP